MPEMFLLIGYSLKLEYIRDNFFQTLLVFSVHLLKLWVDFPNIMKRYHVTDLMNGILFFTLEAFG